MRVSRIIGAPHCSPAATATSPGTGVITELATGHGGYIGIVPKSAGMVAEVLKQYGYATAWIGKNLNTPAWETS